jgi:hypothetical protein
MKDKRSLHLKVQELCDCFATTNPLKEMSELKGEDDAEEAALKWLALSVLHGINTHAKEISIHKSEAGNIKVVAEYRTAELPSPGAKIGEKIFASVREIMHVDGEKAKSPLAIGIRDSNMEIVLKYKQEGNAGSVSLNFPE